MTYYVRLCHFFRFMLELKKILKQFMLNITKYFKQENQLLRSIVNVRKNE